MALAAAPHGRLTATVQKFEGKLPKSDPLGKPDPYVEISFGLHSGRAKTSFIDGRDIKGAAKADVALEWNEELELALPATRTIMHVHLCDDDTAEGTHDDDVVATGYLDLAPLIPAWAKQPLPSISQSRRHDGAPLQEATDGTTMVVELTTTDVVHQGTKIKGGERITLTMVLKAHDLPVEPPPKTPTPEPKVATPEPKAATPVPVAPAPAPAPPPEPERSSALSESVVRTTSGWSYCPTPNAAEHGTTLYSEGVLSGDAARRYAATNVAKNTQILNAAPAEQERSSWAERMARKMLDDEGFSTEVAYEKEQDELGRSQRIGGCVAERDRPIDYFPKPGLLSPGLGLPRLEPLTGPRDSSMLSESRSFASIGSDDDSSGGSRTAAAPAAVSKDLSFTQSVAESGGVSETLSSTMPSIWAL
jgi:hypothetical protein